MKLKNVKVGQTVKVKKALHTTNIMATFSPNTVGLIGTVACVESVDYKYDLTVCVTFPNGETDWGNHKDIKLIEDVD